MFSIASAGCGYTAFLSLKASLALRSFLKQKKKYITVTTKQSAIIVPVFVRKSANESPSDVPIIMFGGSPHMVAAPPKFAQNISDIISGTGSNLSTLESSTVTAARNSTTVILSMNMASTPDMHIKHTRSGTTWYLTAFASLRQSQRKNPAFPMLSTIIIIPKINIMVAQLTPEVLSSVEAYQNEVLKILPKFSVSKIASQLFRQTPKTTSNTSRPLVSVMICLSNLSRTIIKNISTKITTATI